MLRATTRVAPRTLWLGVARSAMASSSASAAVPSAPPVEPTPAQNTPYPADRMPFAEYRALHKKLVLRQRVAGVPVAFCASSGSAFTVATLFPQLFDPFIPQEQVPILFGLDPMVVLFGISGTCFGVGYFAGSALTGLIWRLLNREKAAQMKWRQEDFTRRIFEKRRSGDRQTDDYYGDKVMNLRDYRAWLKAQKNAVPLE